MDVIQVKDDVDSNQVASSGTEEAWMDYRYALQVKLNVWWWERGVKQE